MFSLIHTQADCSNLASPLITSVCLSLAMRLQNAVATKMTGFETRTTHATGSLLNIGIELGNWLYIGLHRNTALTVSFDKNRLKKMTLIITCVFVGGTIGAIYFDSIGYILVAFLSLILAWLTIPVIFKDIVLVWRRK